MNGFKASIDRYGNQFASRVEVNTDDGVIFADVVQESTAQGWYRLVVGGVVLSPMYATKEDAHDAGSVILDRLVEGEEPLERMCMDCEKQPVNAGIKYCDSCLKGEGPEDQAPDFQYEDYPGDVLPTGWDAADHKALYE